MLSSKGNMCLEIVKHFFREEKRKSAKNKRMISKIIFVEASGANLHVEKMQNMKKIR